MSISDRSRKAMENLGLTGYEIRVYLSLLDTGSMTAETFQRNQGFHTERSTRNSTAWRKRMA